MSGELIFWQRHPWLTGLRYLAEHSVNLMVGHPVSSHCSADPTTVLGGGSIVIHK